MKSWMASVSFCFPVARLAASTAYGKKKKKKRKNVLSDSQTPRGSLENKEQPIFVLTNFGVFGNRMIHSFKCLT